jgi:hypothetical protein
MKEVLTARLSRISRAARSLLTIASTGIIRAYNVSDTFKIRMIIEPQRKSKLIELPVASNYSLSALPTGVFVAQKRKAAASQFCRQRELVVSRFDPPASGYSVLY